MSGRVSTWKELPPWPTEDYGEPPAAHDAAVFEYMRLRAWVEWFHENCSSPVALADIRAGEWPS